MQEGKGRGYERWAKIFNVKQMSKVLLYLQEHDIRDYEELQEKAKSSAAKFHVLSDTIKEKEARLQDIADLKMQIINYAKTRDVYAEYGRPDTARDSWKVIGMKSFCIKQRRKHLTSGGLRNFRA